MKNLLLLILIGIGGYWGWNQYQVQTSPAFKCYTQYFNALLEENRTDLNSYASSPEALRPLYNNTRRKALYNQGKERFVYYHVISEHHSPNGYLVQLRVKRVQRYDPPGEDTFYGKKSVSDVHYVTLKKDHSGEWKVTAFEDSTQQ
jgi:hypothetical protein